VSEADVGFRWTAQRREIYDLLVAERDHPTATELFIRAKEHIPGISLATVYNCLETLSHGGLIRQVNCDRNPSRFCPNLREHAHFFDETTGEIIDVPYKEGLSFEDIFELPEGMQVKRADISLKGEFISPKTSPK
jgi:Fur family peroxide stress response transcriptional regulator